MSVTVVTKTVSQYWPQCDACGKPGRGQFPIDAAQLAAFKAHHAACDPAEPSAEAIDALRWVRATQRMGGPNNGD